MSIAETVMQERALNVVAVIEGMLATAERYDSDFARGQASGFTHALEVVRNSLRPYLTPQTPPPTTPQGEPVSRAVGGGSIPTQPKASDR